MTYITLEEAKDQVEVEHENTAHDERLTRLITAGEAWAANFLNAPLADYEESPVQSPPTLPEDVKSGILLHIEFEFDRDERNAAILLQSAERLLWPHRSVYAS